MPAPIPHGSQVYAVESGGLIKIGTTTNVSERMKCLASMSATPITLLGTVKGDRRKEAALHREFKRWRQHGEWFALPEAQRAILTERLSGKPRVIVVTQKPHSTYVKQRKGPVWRKVGGKAARLD